MKPHLLLLATLATLPGCTARLPPSASAPAPATAPVRKDPLAEVPKTDATLSFLEPREGKCQWTREDPVAHKRATVASLDGDCKGARLFWSTDLGKVLVWFDPEWVASGAYFAPGVSPRGFPAEEPTLGATSRLYEVTVASGQVRSVPLPPVEGSLDSFGYKGSELVALSLQSLTEEQMAQDSVTVDGKVIALDKEVEGAPALAFAHRLGADGKWQRVEVKATGEGSDYAPGTRALEIAASLGPNSDTLLDARMGDEGTEPTGEQAQKLRPLRPAPLLQPREDDMDTGGEWSHVVTPGGSFYAWRVSGDFMHTTGHLVLEVGGQLKPVKDLGFTDGDFVAVQAQGPFLLVSADSVGTHPRLYDLRTGARVFHSDTARVATFWPSPAH